MTTMIPPAQRIPIADQSGNVTRPWYLWLQEVQSRLGAVGPSNAELQTQIETGVDSLALGVFGKAAPQAQQPPDLGYIRAFMPRQQPAPQLEDASAILCNRTFARR